jgi:hypothetical protein
MTKVTIPELLKEGISKEEKIDSGIEPLGRAGKSLNLLSELFNFFGLANQRK